ncbi:hypothetical protein ASZ90_009893 [hydrocarbon metagenome]|uniref:Uncharacterized protein n=1 Tax=hydrocarbon metagenome TaxID=938273 RepID=A0A0W8FHJ3_9ZZZZ
MVRCLFIPIPPSAMQWGGRSAAEGSLACRYDRGRRSIGRAAGRAARRVGSEALADRLHRTRRRRFYCRVYHPLRAAAQHALVRPRLCGIQPLDDPGRSDALFPAGRPLPEIPARADRDPRRFRRIDEGRGGEGQLPDLSRRTPLIALLAPLRRERRPGRGDRHSCQRYCGVLSGEAPDRARIRRRRAGVQRCRPRLGVQRHHRQRALHRGICHRVPGGRQVGCPEVPDLEPACGRHRVYVLSAPRASLVRPEHPICPGSRPAARLHPVCDRLRRHRSDARGLYRTLHAGDGEAHGAPVQRPRDPAPPCRWSHHRHRRLLHP